MRHLLLIIGVLALAGCGEKDFPETSSTKIQTTSESGADTESQVEIVPITAEEAADIAETRRQEAELAKAEEEKQRKFAEEQRQQAVLAKEPVYQIGFLSITDSK